jgi:pyruvate ferredoxin oxidoreductase gamma subunit
MIKVRVHGRGGEGAVTFAQILCASVRFDGKFGLSCMSPAAERRGAPVEAFARIGDKRIAERGNIAKPDIVTVLNPALTRIVNVEAGMNDGGKLIINARNDPGMSHATVYLDATSIALRILGVPITNTVMLGAFAAATGLVTLESLEKGTRLLLSSRFSEEKLQRNLEAIRAGYEEVKVG